MIPRCVLLLETNSFQFVSQKLSVNTVKMAVKNKGHGNGNEAFL